MAVRQHVRLAIVPVAGAVGVLAVTLARRSPAWSFAGASTLGAVAELSAGWSLVAAGALFSIRHPRNRVGVLLAGAGIAWFLPEWSNPEGGSALIFAVGLIGFIACAPLAAHAALAYPIGHLVSALHRAVLVVSYAAALLLLGLLPATVFEPKAVGCVDCPRNLVLLRSDAGLFGTFNHYGVRIGLAWTVALGSLLAWRLLRSLKAGAGGTVLVLIPAMVYVALVAWDFAYSLPRAILSTDSFDRLLWRFEALSLTALALAIIWALHRERRARAAVARTVADLRELPEPGTVRATLARTLDDQTLQLAYPRSAGGGYVEASGRAIDVEPGESQAVTPLLRGDTPVGALVHDARLLDAPGLLQEVIAAARLAIENERLQAELRAQLEELKASRARIIETGDTARRRLERDLHDGAQQRLLALAYDLRVARATAEGGGEPTLTTLLTAAADEAQAALGELRGLAHGLYPAILAEAGLASALQTLAEEAPLAVELDDVTAERYSTLVETAAYRTVVESIADAVNRSATVVSVDVNGEGDRLIVTVTDDGADRTELLVNVADRVGALGGIVEVGPTAVRAEIPCA